MGAHRRARPARRRAAPTAIAARRVSSGQYGASCGSIQHKREAYWFYRFLSLGYDRWVNPLFWTPAMRAQALDAARLDDAGPARRWTRAPAPASPPRGSSSGSTPARVTMLDQSPHQLARARAQARARRACAQAARRRRAAAVRGRRVRPLRVRRQHRVLARPAARRSPRPTASLRPGGVGVVIGPVQPANPLLRRLSEHVDAVPVRGGLPGRGSSAPASRTSSPPRSRPDWYRGRSPLRRRDRRAEAAPATGPARPRREDRAAPMSPSSAARASPARFVLGSAAGAAVRPDRRRARAARPAGAPRGT